MRWAGDGWMQSNASPKPPLPPTSGYPAVGFGRCITKTLTQKLSSPLWGWRMLNYHHHRQSAATKTCRRSSRLLFWPGRVLGAGAVWLNWEQLHGIRWPTTVRLIPLSFVLRTASRKEVCFSSVDNPLHRQTTFCNNSSIKTTHLSSASVSEITQTHKQNHLSIIWFPLVTTREKLWSKLTAKIDHHHHQQWWSSGHSEVKIYSKIRDRWMYHTCRRLIQLSSNLLGPIKQSGVLKSITDNNRCLLYQFLPSQK